MDFFTNVRATMEIASTTFKVEKGFTNFVLISIGHISCLGSCFDDGVSFANVSATMVTVQGLTIKHSAHNLNKILNIKNTLKSTSDAVHNW